jgi:diaminohydroxyphosphoribosylaminopyrimidine deaminase/5-amino-6-(5-phosphoribosylamino)uracil reductase
MNTHNNYMQLAIQNAAAMRGQTDPNPLVGAVIVNENHIVGIGVHLRAGEAHAEIHAIRMAGDKAKGSTLYVTLEPCAHHGRTGPCAQAIIEACIKKVVIAALDPNPLVSGKGVTLLKEAGIEVISGVCQAEAQSINEVFNKFIVQQVPFVTLKTGMTLDGKIASYSSDSKWITSEAAREDAHQLRNQHAAILVGVNTILQDDPQLTTRIPNGRNPIRLVLDSTLRIPLDAKVVRDQQASTWIFTTSTHDPEKRKALEDVGIRVIVVSRTNQLSVKDVLKVLGEEQIASLLIEGGGAVNASFFENKLVDKLVIYVAPKLIGGRDAPTFLEGAGIHLMKHAVELADLNIEKVGNDFKLSGYPNYGS